MFKNLEQMLTKIRAIKKIDASRVPAPSWAKSPTAQTFLLTSLAVMLGLVISVALRTGAEKIGPLVVHGPTAPRPSEAATQVVLENLDWAEVQAVAGLVPQIAAVKQFFDAARERTRYYSEAVLGWDSKWKLASDYVTGRKEHAEFLQAQFEATLFSKTELDQLVQQSVNAFLRHTEDVESQMLVRMRADLERLPSEELPTLVDESELYSALTEAVRQASCAAQSELGATVGREVVSYVAGEVLAMVAAKLATSAGILTAGAGSSWATFGVGVVISLVADAIVTEIYQQQFDPIGKLTALMDGQLDYMEWLILKGTEESPGLESRLQQYAYRRNAARRQAVEQAVLAL